MPVDGLLDCPVCLEEFDETKFAQLTTCTHRSCFKCFKQYLQIAINESRVDIKCPKCSEAMHPIDIQSLLNNPVMYDKYEYFMVRRVLAADPDTRYCPAPDCSYAVIAAGCAKCPKIKCKRPGCDSYFCYHCKAAWNPNHTCEPTRVETDSTSDRSDLSPREDIRACPHCKVLSVKLNGCNFVKCTVCGSEFCWSCMKEVCPLHFISPSGCTFYGKKPWSRKKKLFWQLVALTAAPVGISLIVGIGIPSIVIGAPAWYGHQRFKRYKQSSRLKRNCAKIARGLIFVNESTPRDGLLKCPLCLKKRNEKKFGKLSTCAHRFCFKCFQEYLRIEIRKSRVDIKCPVCSKAMHRSDIKSLLNNPVLYDKYEGLMVQPEVRQGTTIQGQGSW